ncbi:MAG: Spx/MgsR family RNA polymerase-binding regulatory protein [Pseudomonadota bacterium]
MTHAKHSVAIYGIKNCDTMKKAFQWLDQHHVSYVFHDYKKAGVDTEILHLAMEQHGWEKVLNRNGTSWRSLPDNVRDTMDASRAVKAALENPSLIRRPLMVKDGSVHFGFDADKYTMIFPDMWAV